MWREWQAFALKYSAKAFLTEIFFQGVPNKVEKLQKFQGVGGGYDKHPVKWKFQWGEGLKQKCPPWGRRGGKYGCFLELHNISFIDTVDQPLKAPTFASDTTADDERDVNKLTTKFWMKRQLTCELYKCACLIDFRNLISVTIGKLIILFYSPWRPWGYHCNN